jgi:predicted O-methyltransferase YrrM
MHELIDRGIRYAYALAACGYLFTVGAFSRKHRSLIGKIAAHFGYHRLGEAPNLPTSMLDQMVGPDTVVRLRAAGAVEGNVTIPELVAIAQLVTSRHAMRLFEIGTFDGRTTLAMADNAPPEANVYTLDLPRSDLNSTALDIDPNERHLIDKLESGSRFRGASDINARIHQLWGDSAAFDYAAHEGRCDFVFVDGSHAYDYVLNDSAVAMKLIGRSGVIVWHDYGEWPGVTRALNHLYASDPRFFGLRAIPGTTLAVLVISR